MPHADGFQSCRLLSCGFSIQSCPKAGSLELTGFGVVGYQLLVAGSRYYPAQKQDHSN